MPAVSPLPSLRPDIRAMQPYTPGEQVMDHVKLNTNEVAWPCSPAVPALLARYPLDRLRRYPDPLARELRQVAAEVFGCQADHVLPGNGSDDCLTILYRACCPPGSAIACPWPTYGLYDTCAAIQGIEARHAPFKLDGYQAWQLPVDELLALGGRLTLIANPNNPSATLSPLNAIRQLAERCTGLVVVDEAYIDFADNPQAATAVGLVQEYPNIVVLRTLSKSYALAGARVGFLIGNPELVAQLVKVKDSYNVGALPQAIACAALKDRAYHAQLVRQTVEARAHLQEGLAQFGWSWAPSQGNFLLCRVGPRAQALYLGLKERGMLVRFWNTQELRERLRITTGTIAQQEQLLVHLRELGA